MLCCAVLEIFLVQCMRNLVFLFYSPWIWMFWGALHAKSWFSVVPSWIWCFVMQCTRDHIGTINYMLRVYLRCNPSFTGTEMLSAIPSELPSLQPSDSPSGTGRPTRSPSLINSDIPSVDPSSSPSMRREVKCIVQYIRIFLYITVSCALHTKHGFHCGGLVLVKFDRMNCEVQYSCSPHPPSHLTLTFTLNWFWWFVVQCMWNLVFFVLFSLNLNVLGCSAR